MQILNPIVNDSFMIIINIKSFRKKEKDRGREKGMEIMTPAILRSHGKKILNPLMLRFQG